MVTRPKHSRIGLMTLVRIQPPALTPGSSSAKTWKSIVVKPTRVGGSSPSRAILVPSPQPAVPSAGVLTGRPYLVRGQAEPYLING